MKIKIEIKLRKSIIKVLTLLIMQSNKTKNKDFRKKLERIKRKLSINSEVCSLKVREIVLLYECAEQTYKYLDEVKDKPDSSELYGELFLDVGLLIDFLAKEVPECAL